jgi:NADH-quinone oxidoreductase subunit A
MPAQYIAIFLFAAVAIGVPFLCLYLFKRSKPDEPAPESPAARDSGDAMPSMEAVTRPLYAVRVFVAAAMFLIVEAAIALLALWAVKYTALGLYGLVAAFVFLSFIVAGYFWVSNSGLLNWAETRAAEPSSAEGPARGLANAESASTPTTELVEAGSSRRSSPSPDS